MLLPFRFSVISLVSVVLPRAARDLVKTSLQRPVSRHGDRLRSLRMRGGQNQVTTCGPRVGMVAEPDACLGVEVFSESGAFAQGSEPFTDLVG